MRSVVKKTYVKKNKIRSLKPKISKKKSKSPKRKSKSPKRKTKSPKRKIKSPKRKSKSPKLKSKSPKRKSKSLKRKIKSPKLKSKSLKRKTKSPKRKTTSLKRKTKSPKRKTTSLKRKTKSPKRKSKSPKLKSKSLKHKSSKRKSTKKLIKSKVRKYKKILKGGEKIDTNKNLYINTEEDGVVSENEIPKIKPRMKEVLDLYKIPIDMIIDIKGDTYKYVSYYNQLLTFINKVLYKAKDELETPCIIAKDDKYLMTEQLNQIINKEFFEYGLGELFSYFDKLQLDLNVTGNEGLVLKEGKDPKIPEFNYENMSIEDFRTFGHKNMTLRCRYKKKNGTANDTILLGYLPKKNSFSKIISESSDPKYINPFYNTLSSFQKISGRFQKLFKKDE